METVRDEQIQPQLRVMQIVTVALIVGVVIFLCIVVTLHQGMAPEIPDFIDGVPFVSAISVFIVMMNIPLGQFVTSMQTQGALKQLAAAGESDGDITRLLQIRQTGLILSQALIEGPAFLGCMGILLEDSWLGLVAVGLALMVMLAMFPTKGRLRGWLERQQRRLREMRDFGLNS